MTKSLYLALLLAACACLAFVNCSPVSSADKDAAPGTIDAGVIDSGPGEIDASLLPACVWGTGVWGQCNWAN